ncbi:ABC transporter substrate-binding protein [Paenibacillus senegalensis]|uniref:ABC transporter substrate-binding protein n=1 Tax=Paenibacillus senegalensis TaxID=1465766 RepID=UPI00028869C1|nr:sugar ABC transporter substrate-binding protein [Paenibacillus senegalensis]
MKKTGLGFVASIMLISTACGSSPSQGGQESEGSDVETITLHAAVQNHSSVEAVQALLNEYEADNNVKVVFDVLPQEEIFSKTELALASASDQYDIIMTENMFIPKYARADWLLDLNDYIESTGLDMEDFSQGFLEALSSNGSVYAIPFYGESSMLMYNKEIFEENGITSPPQTIDELVSIAEQLTKDGKYGIAMRGLRGQGMNVYTWAGFFNAMGGQWFTEDGQPNVNSPESIQSVEIYADLLSNYAPPGGTEFSWDQVQLNVQQGNVAMAIDATNFASRIEDPDNSTVVGKIGYASVPSGPAGSFPSVSTWGMAIPKHANHPKEAFDFISWVTSKEIQLKTALEGNRADVTRNSVFEDPQYIERYNYDDGNWVDVTSRAFNESYANYRPRIEEWNRFGDLLGIALSEVMAGRSAEEALNNAQKEIEGFLQ